MDITSTPNNRKVDKKRKRIRTTDEEQRQIAKAVEQNPVIWNLAHPNHKKLDALDAAWKRVGVSTKLSVVKAKSGWDSLKDRYRYKISPPKPKKKKSGDEGGDNLEEPTEWSQKANDSMLYMWEFWDVMKFFHENRAKRSTLDSLDSIDLPEYLENETSPETYSEPETNEDILFSDELFSSVAPIASSQSEARSSSVAPSNSPSTTGTPAPQKRNDSVKSAQRASAQTSAYDYMIKKMTIKEQTVKLVTNVEKLVEFKNKEYETVSGASNQSPKYMSIYTNLDRMLCQLPAHVVEDLNHNITSTVYQELKKHLQ